MGGVTDEAQHGLIIALGDVDAQVLALEPVDEGSAHVGADTVFENDDHNVYLRIG